MPTISMTYSRGFFVERLAFIVPIRRPDSGRFDNSYLFLSLRVDNAAQDLLASVYVVRYLILDRIWCGKD